MKLVDDILLKENNLKRLIYEDKRHWLLYLSQTSWKEGKIRLFCRRTFSYHKV